MQNTLIVIVVCNQLITLGQSPKDKSIKTNNSYNNLIRDRQYKICELRQHTVKMLKG